LADLTLLQMVNDFAVSGGVSFVAYGTTAFVTTAVCSVFAAPAAVVVVAGIGSAVVGTYGYQYAMEEVREYFYEHRPMDPRAEMAGHLVGGIVGGYVGVETGAEVGEAIRWRWLYPNYATYEAEARALTEQTYNANRKTIDPKSMRGPASHLDHETSVRMGIRDVYPARGNSSPAKSPHHSGASEPVGGGEALVGCDASSSIHLGRRSAGGASSRLRVGSIGLDALVRWRGSSVNPAG
jgi:hypothetical protein